MAQPSTIDPQRGSRVLAAFMAERDAQRALRVASDASRKPQHMRRSYSGAAIGRLTASFDIDSASLNEDLERSLRILRGRSRHLAKNNDYVRKFLHMVQNHVVGAGGFALSVPALRPDGSIDDDDKRVCEHAFARWARRGVCEVSTRLSFVQFARLWILHVARDGEAIVRRVRDRRINGFGYALQLVDPVLLDETYRADLAGGVRIRMGVEVDANHRPLAYHLLRNAEHGALGSSRIRVPADEIWHSFVQEEATQVRGVPWVHTAMRRLNDLGGYEEAAVIAARVGASNMGFFVPPLDAATGAIGGTVGTDAIDADGAGGQARVREAEPGAFDELPPGYDFKSFDPDYPHEQYGAFVKGCLRGIASGIGVDYNTLANDLEGVNYSSIRSGTLETREEWMAIQNWMIDSLLAPLWPEWLSHAFLAGELDPLPVSKYEKYNVAQWQGRRWAWVDPKKDIEAKMIEIDNALTSYSAVMREMGRDPEAVWRELERDKQRIAGLVTARPAASVGGVPPKEDEDEAQT